MSFFSNNIRKFSTYPSQLPGVLALFVMTATNKIWLGTRVDGVNLKQDTDDSQICRKKKPGISFEISLKVVIEKNVGSKSGEVFHVSYFLEMPKIQTTNFEPQEEDKKKNNFLEK